MILERSTHPSYLSNTWLAAPAPGGPAIIVDAGAPPAAIMRHVDEHQLTVTHVLLTHEHHDHVDELGPLVERYDPTVVMPGTALSGGSITCGELTLEPRSTPGHCEPHISWVVRRGDDVVGVFCGDALFRESVGGTLNGGPNGLATLRRSILAELLSHPPDTLLWPGHTEPTTVRHELAHNPFVLLWHGELAPVSEPVVVAGSDAELLLRATDYDGGDKVLVRFSDGREAIVGGRMVRPRTVPA